MKRLLGFFTALSFIALPCNADLIATCSPAIASLSEALLREANGINLIAQQNFMGCHMASDTTDATIKRWAEKGRLCESIGHRWETTVTDECVYSLDPALQIRARKCSICGKTETRRMGDWK